MGKALRAAFLASCLAMAAEPSVAAESAPAAAPEVRFNEVLATTAVLKQMLTGGYVLYLRHGNTDNSRPDRFPAVDLADCSTQRPLNELGRQVAAKVGKAMRKAAIPIAEIRISPLCRVRETTETAFPGLAFTVDNELMYTANLTTQQKAPILANTRQLLSTAVPKGNRLLVAHAPNLMDLLGYFPKEGTLVIFRPQGNGGFEYIASIPPAHWQELQR